MSLAHYFTILRILLSPLFPLLYLEHQSFGISTQFLPYILLFLLCVCESSDLVDGVIARRRNQVTDLGKVLDPMADSITHLTLLFTFTRGLIALPLILILVFLYRDLIISTLRILCAMRGVSLAARMSGKMKTFLQACVLFLIVGLMIPYNLGFISLSFLQNVSLYSAALAALYSVVSAADYLIANRIYIKQALKT